MRKVKVSGMYGLNERGINAKLDDFTGIFHGFGCDYEEFENGAGNYSTAIVELDDGKIVNPPVECIQFLGGNNDATK